MIEKTPDRRGIITRIAQHPVFYVRANKERGKSCAECIFTLRKVREEIKADDTISINHPDQRFALYVRSKNQDVDHYVALFEILKEAGFLRTDIESALIDDFPIRGRNSTGKSISGGEIVRLFLSLTRQALDRVFASDAEKSS